MQPTWLDTHKVPRSASGMNTISKSWASARAQQPFAGAVGRNLRLDHFGPADDEPFRQPGPLVLAMSVIAVEVGHPAMVDPVPDLLGAQLGRLGIEPRLGEQIGDLLRGRPTRSVRPSARGVIARGTGKGSMCPGICISAVSAIMASGIDTSGSVANHSGSLSNHPLIVSLAPGAVEATSDTK